MIKSKKSSKSSKKSKTLKQTKGCAQTIVNIPHVKCLKKNKCLNNSKKINKLNQKYDNFLVKKCGNLEVQTTECIQKNRNGNFLFDKIIELEDKESICRNKCKKHQDITFDCIDIGEKECRNKYKDLINKNKMKLLPFKKCEGGYIF